MAQAARRAARLREKLDEAAALLRDRFGACDAWLFGSLTGGDVSPRSDVDLAVSGLCSERYFEALAELGTLFGVPVDLVEIERAPTTLRQLIEQQGRRL